MSPEVYGGPMSWMSISFKPDNTLGVDFMHLAQDIVKIGHCGGSRGFPKQFGKLGMLELGFEVLNKVAEAPAMWRAREPGPDGFQKPFLMV